MRILFLLFILVSCGYKFNAETNEELALGRTTCVSYENRVDSYCENIYNGYRTCYRNNLDYVITCDEYDRVAKEN